MDSGRSGYRRKVPADFNLGDGHAPVPSASGPMTLAGQFGDEDQAAKGDHQDDRGAEQEEGNHPQQAPVRDPWVLWVARSIDELDLVVPDALPFDGPLVRQGHPMGLAVLVPERDD